MVKRWWIVTAAVLVVACGRTGVDVGRSVDGQSDLVLCIEGRPCPDEPTPTTTVVVPTPPPPPTSTSEPALPSWHRIEGGVLAVQGLTPMEALHALAPDRLVGPADRAAVRDGEARSDAARYRAVAEAGEHAGWTLILDGGYGALRDDRLADLSRAGRALVIHHYTDGAWCQFGLAERGQVVRRFGQEGYDLPGTVGRRLPEEAGLALGQVSESWPGLRTLFTRLVGWDAYDGVNAIPADRRLAVAYPL